MALQTSGAISFSQIAAHFGGSGSHSLSEYHALAGKGVSGIPSSGSISFSHFHGKSNQVTTSVWVSSGYNQTTLVDQGQHYDGDNFSYYIQADSHRHQITIRQSPFGNPTGFWRLNIYGNNAGRGTLWVGDWRFSSGSYGNTARDSSRYYYARVHKNVTSWVDTSGYQNQTTTAQITT